MDLDQQSHAVTTTATSSPAAPRPGRKASWRRAARAEPRPHGHDLDPRGASRDPAALARIAAEARQALEEAICAARRALSVAAALDEALAALEAKEGAPAAPALPAPYRMRREVKPLSPLSPREREVLVLVAEGRSNKSIAEALYVSPNTVKTHVASLLSKLHVETRVQLATLATQQGVR